MPLATYTLVTRAGYPASQAAFQALLDAIDGMVVVYLTFLMQKGRQAAHDSNRQLRDANEKITESMARTREVIELAPDAFFQADLDARFTDVNQAACRLLGYDRDELIGKTIIDIIPPEDVPRLAAAREYLLSPDTVQRGRVDATEKGRHTDSRRGERKDSARRPLAGVRARHQRAQTHRTGAAGIGGAISTHDR